jgi:predicted nucleic acid-binding protein
VTATLVDSNVILDVVQDDAEWGDWSASMLSTAADAGRLVINPIIYAEVSCGFDRIEDLDVAVPPEYFAREPLPWEGAFLAARAFLGYRRRGGQRTAPLPDFFIGAHAAVAGYALLTRDPRRYSAYFPKLRIIAP